MVNYGSYNSKEEILNAVSHWIGFALGIVGLIFLVIFGVRNKSVLQITGFSIYGASLIILYLCSALYHSIPFMRAKNVLRILDHLSIYLLIAGTYTPIILNSFRGSERIILISVIWSLSLVGIIYKLFIKSKFSKFAKLSTFIYVFLGWVSILLIKRILLTTSFNFVVLLFVGGILYSVGSIFYIDKKIPYNHFIWHIFVLAASFSHYLGIMGAYALGGI